MNAIDIVKEQAAAYDAGKSYAVVTITKVAIDTTIRKATNISPATATRLRLNLSHASAHKLRLFIPLVTILPVCFSFMVISSQHACTVPLYVDQQRRTEYQQEH